jgi:hypothetical protein
MTLSATATADTSGTVSPKTSPNSITTINYYNRPNSVSDWTTSAPQVLYTAPSSCKYARIVIPDTAKQSNTSYNDEAFTIESDGTHNRWLGIGIVNDTNNSEDMILKNYSANTSYKIMFNSFSNDAISNQYNYMNTFNRGPFDVVVVHKNNSNYYNYTMISGDRFILNPGEKFVALTGNNNTQAYIYANFQAWVYN